MQDWLKTQFKNSADAAFSTDTITIGDTGSPIASSPHRS